MQWLNTIADDLIARRPEGEILIESGASPSGIYHLGHMRELMTADAIMLELNRRGRKARHIHYVDDMDAFRKVPHNVPPEYEKYLMMPLCDIPAPDGSDQSYAEYFLRDLITACKYLGISAEFIRSHERYREGSFVSVIEQALTHISETRQILKTISGHSLPENWGPFQVLEGDGKLYNRELLALDTATHTITYLNGSNSKQVASYADGHVKLDWRVDWPGRWWLMKVDCEPSGRDHMTKGGSYDTGAKIMHDIYGAEPPYPVSYDFINMAGDTKKMSASKGTGLSVSEAIRLLPPEVIRFFVFRSPPTKRLYFDPVNDVVRLIDEYAALVAKSNRSDSEAQLLYLTTSGNAHKQTVSQIPFSLLVSAYQTALKNPDQTITTIRRSEYKDLADSEADQIREELVYIEEWLKTRAPDNIKFQLLDSIQPADFSEDQRQFLNKLADVLTDAPAEADGSWFHQAVYSQKDNVQLSPKEMFQTLYKVLIGKDSGPRVGWFLSILPRDWLMKRLRLEE
jgi:lysyl-tRNA synthetase class 1